MAKLKEFLRQLAETAEVRNTDLEALLGASALADLEMPDAAIETINKNLMTRQRALSDPDLVKKARTEAKGFFMDLVDDKIKLFLPKLPQEIQDALKEEKDTLKRIEIIRNAFDKASEAAKEDAGKNVRKTEEEFRKQITDLNLEMTTLKSNHEKSLADFKLKTTLKSMIFGQDIDKSFAPIKETIANGVIDNLSKKYKLQLDKDNESSVLLLQDVDGTLKDVYENNTKLNLETALLREMEPFIVKNNNGGNAGGGGNGGGNSGGSKKFEGAPQPQTLAEMRAAKAQGQS